MAKYTVSHSCGHDEVHQLTGPHKQREWRLEKLAAEDCSDCREKAFRAKCETENAACKEVNSAAGLVALTGSEKQIAWAETIRARALASARTQDAEHVASVLAIRIVHEEDLSTKGVRDDSRTDQIVSEVRDAIALIVAELEQQTAARWWIDNREVAGNRDWLAGQIRQRLTLVPTLAALIQTLRDRKSVEEVSRG